MMQLGTSTRAGRGYASGVEGRQPPRSSPPFLHLLLIVAIFAVVAVASAGTASGLQGAPVASPELSGYYEGVAHTQNHGEVPLSINLSYDRKHASGVVHTPLGDFTVSRGRYSGGVLELTIQSYDDEATITASVNNGIFTGRLVGFGENARLELTRTGPFRPPSDSRPVVDLSASAWREDLRFLAQELPARHKNAFHRTSREQFESAVAELDRRIPSLDDIRVVMELGRIVAMVGDGHTGLDWSRAFPTIPLRLRWFGDDLRVVKTVPAHARALGARVVRIGTAATREAYERSLAYIAQGESREHVMEVSASHLTYPAHLHAFGLAADALHAEYALEDDRGRPFSLRLAAVDPEARPAWLDAARRTPLSRQRPDELLWFTYLKRSGAVYLNFRGYPRRPAFAAFADAFFGFLDRQKLRRVVVDLRENGGGDLTRGRQYIVAGFNKRAAILPKGRLFVLVGRTTFSAGMANAADLRNELGAILVGEPTGGRPNAYTENRTFSLPNSRLVVSYSTQYYTLAPEDTPGLIPDRRVDVSWAEYREGHDPVLQWALTNQDASSAPTERSALAASP